MMAARSKFAIVGMAALIASAIFVPRMTTAGEVGCQPTATCPASPLFETASEETCTFIVPDLTGGVTVDLCGDTNLCARIIQTPEAGTEVGIGLHAITITVEGCFIVPPARGNDNDNTGNGNGNGNDNSGAGDGDCPSDDCFPIETCFVELNVFEPQPELICPDVLEPVSVGDDCLVTIPDLVGEGGAFVTACIDPQSYMINQSPMAGAQVQYFGDPIEIQFSVGQLEQVCSAFLPVHPVTECPSDLFLSANSETCMATLPDLCDGYLLDCESENEARGGGNGFLQCRTEPPAGTELGVGEHSVQIIVEECFFNPGSIGEVGEECIELPELGCTVTVYVDGPSPQIVCPEVQPEFDPIQLSADCTVVVPDLRDLVSVDACPGTEFELLQSPEAGSTYEVGNSGDYLSIFVYLEGGKGPGPSCFFYIPLNAVVSCPDTPQTISYDENCEAVIPDLTDEVEVADCCEELQPVRADFNCGEIRITQSPEAGSPLTGPTDVTIIVERCFTFSGEQLEARGVEGEECITLGSCVVRLNPVDDTPPVITNCPGDLTLGADADCLGVIPDLLVPDVTGLAIATDNCTATEDIVLTQSPAAGSEIGLGTTVVTVTATDEAGNSTTCSVTIELEANGCNTPPAPEPEPEPEPEPQPVPGCDPNNQSVNLLFSLLFHSPVCGATCPITVSLTLCGIFGLRRTLRRKRRR